MPPKQAKKTYGVTPSQMRLEPDVLEALDRVAYHNGLPSRTAAVRFLARAYGGPLPAIPKGARKKS